jgi:hypothetical protein
MIKFDLIKIKLSIKQEIKIKKYHKKNEFFKKII